jgi:putative hemolysin
MDWVFKVYYFESNLSHPVIYSVKVNYSGSYKFVRTEVQKLMRNGCVIEYLPDGRTTIVKPISIEVVPHCSKEKV